MPQAAVAPKVLSPDEVAAYERDGFLICRDVFELREIEELASESEALGKRKDLMDSNNLRCRWKNHHRTGECTFECFDPVIDIGAACERTARDSRITGRVADLYGEPAHLFKDKLIFKPAGVEGYNLHQDWISWPGFPASFVTVLVAIDAASEENGCTMAYPGRHRDGFAGALDGGYHETPPAFVAGVEPVPLCLARGDIAIFGGFTPHFSHPNRSDAARRQLYLSYNSDSDGGDRRDAHYAEFHAWLRGRYADFGRKESYFQ
ncbi:MAG TPA: phytanoyl-CoA dioxygenase family protein [Planctomycetia bacterium]|nr:phytanoyl-CoA dioxygenase family protein [Planctomycetia bacterium]